MKKIVFMFPGQGTQVVGMMRDLYNEFPVIRETLCEAEEILGRNIRNLMFQGPFEELAMTTNTQPIIVAAEIALYRVAVQQGLDADFLVGYSLGEWAAAIAGGSLSFQDGLLLVRARAEAMQAAVPVGKGGMAVIMGKGPAEVRSICTALPYYVVPSNYNYPGQITVSGDIRAIQELKAMGASGDLIVTPLEISVPSHCDLMQPAAKQLSSLMESVCFRNSQYPIVMNATGDMTYKADAIKQNLIVQLTTAVHFEQSVRSLLDHDIDIFLELGPGKTLAGFVRKTAKAVKKRIFSNRMDNVQDFQATVAAIRERL